MQILIHADSWDWYATSFTPSKSFYQKLASIVVAAPEIDQIKTTPGGTIALGLQPISSSLVNAGNARGGNALGLQAINQTWFVLDAGWLDADGDAVAHDATRAFSERVRREAVDEGVDIPYIFMNDASYDQDVIAHYGEANVRRLRDVQARYDPGLVFQRLVPGGFKIPAAG